MEINIQNIGALPLFSAISGESNLGMVQADNQFYRFFNAIGKPAPMGEANMVSEDTKVQNTFLSALVQKNPESGNPIQILSSIINRYFTSDQGKTGNQTDSSGQNKPQILMTGLLNKIKYVDSNINQEEMKLDPVNLSIMSDIIENEDSNNADYESLLGGLFNRIENTLVNLSKDKKELDIDGIHESKGEMASPDFKNEQMQSLMVSLINDIKNISVDLNKGKAVNGTYENSELKSGISTAIDVVNTHEQKQIHGIESQDGPMNTSMLGANVLSENELKNVLHFFAIYLRYHENSANPETSSDNPAAILHGPNKEADFTELMNFLEKTSENGALLDKLINYLNTKTTAEAKNSGHIISEIAKDINNYIEKHPNLLTPLDNTKQESISVSEPIAESNQIAFDKTAGFGNVDNKNQFSLKTHDQDQLQHPQKIDNKTLSDNKEGTETVIGYTADPATDEVNPLDENKQIASPLRIGDIASHSTHDNIEAKQADSSSIKMDWSVDKEERSVALKLNQTIDSKSNATNNETSGKTIEQSPGAGILENKKVFHHSNDTKDVDTSFGENTSDVADEAVQSTQNSESKQDILNKGKENIDKQQFQNATNIKESNETVFHQTMNTKKGYDENEKSLFNTENPKLVNELSEKLNKLNASNVSYKEEGIANETSRPQTENTNGDTLKNEIIAGSATKSNTTMVEKREPINQEAFQNSHENKIASEKTMMNQIINRAVLELGKNKSELKIDIKPETLGAIKIQVTNDNHQVIAKITAENVHVKEVIERHLDHLKTDLNKGGLQIDSVNVSVEQEDNSGKSGTKEEYAYARQARNMARFRQNGLNNNAPEGKNKINSYYRKDAAVDYYA